MLPGLSRYLSVVDGLEWLFDGDIKGQCLYCTDEKFKDRAFQKHISELLEQYGVDLFKVVAHLRNSFKVYLMHGQLVIEGCILGKDLLEAVVNSIDNEEQLDVHVNVFEDEALEIENAIAFDEISRLIDNIGPVTEPG